MEERWRHCLRNLMQLSVVGSKTWNIFQDALLYRNVGIIICQTTKFSKHLHRLNEKVGPKAILCGLVPSLANSHLLSHNNYNYKSRALVVRYEPNQYLINISHAFTKQHYLLTVNQILQLLVRSRNAFFVSFIVCCWVILCNSKYTEIRS